MGKVATIVCMFGAAVAVIPMLRRIKMQLIPQTTAQVTQAYNQFNNKKTLRAQCGLSRQNKCNMLAEAASNVQRTSCGVV